MIFRSATKRISIYLSAGYATAPDFLHGCAEELAGRFHQSGWNCRVRVFFPYGDWSRKGRLQLHEIASDLWNGARQKNAAYGGKSLSDFVSEHSAPDEPLLLIGHSGGGVASVHAASRLERAGRGIAGVIQIGSPKCAVPADLRQRVLYIYAAGDRAAGRAADPVTRIGTWGGWVPARAIGWRWASRKHAPAFVKPLRLAGGHADYFRDHPLFVLDGESNLQQTVHTIWSWLCETYPHQFT